MRTIGYWCAALVACLTLAGCGIVTVTKPGEHRSALESTLSELKDSGRSAPLKSLTDFDWDTVYLFREYTSRDEVEKVVGQPVIDGDAVSSGSLLVFEKSGDIVEKAYVTGDYLRADQPTWRSDVLVEPWGQGFLRLTAPH